MFLMMPSTKIAQMVLLHKKKGAARALDKKYFQMKSPEPLVLNQNTFHRNGPHIALYQNWSEGSAWLNNMATTAKNRSIFKS